MGELRGELTNPVFVHGMWRTGSTYFWSKFRDRPGVCAYYEPLNEQLLTLTEEDRDRDKSEVMRALRHTGVEKGYFNEYALQSGGGVAGLLPEFCYLRYVLEEDDEDAELESYFRGLISAAASRGQSALLQCNRTVLKIGWIKRRLGGLHILLVRSPRDIWRSFCTQPIYFRAGVCQIVALNSGHPLLKPLAERWHVPPPSPDSPFFDFKRYGKFAQSLGGELYGLFYAFYVVTILCGARYADLIVDLGAVSEHAEVRAEAESRLAALGLSIALYDCSVPRHESADPDLIGVEEDVQTWLAREVTAEVARGRDLIDERALPLSDDVQSVLDRYAGWHPG